MHLILYTSRLHQTTWTTTGKTTDTLPGIQHQWNKNVAGTITHTIKIRVTIGQHTEQIQFAITNIGKLNVFLGYDWLKKHNPSINWINHELSFERCPKECGYHTKLRGVDEDLNEIFKTSVCGFFVARVRLWP